MSFNLCIYLEEKPIIDELLSRKFDLIDYGAGFNLDDLSKSLDQRIKVHCYGLGLDGGTLQIETKNMPEHFPRYSYEGTTLELGCRRDPLPWDVAIKSFRGNNGLLVADADVYEALVDHQIMQEPTDRYARIIGLLERTKGRPTYHVEVFTFDENKVADITELAIFLARKYTGYIWDPHNGTYGEPNMDAILQNAARPGWLSKFMQEAEEQYNTLKLVDD